jgi:hypothetical protein
MAAFVITSVALTGSIPALAQQNDKAHAEMNKKVHKLKGLKLKQIIAKEIIGDSSRRAAAGVCDQG